MKYVTVILSVIFLLLQVRLWHGDGNLIEVIHLNRQASKQRQDITQFQARNAQLFAEVQDLKHRLGAIEERARMDLGMIREGETFYQFITPEESKLLASMPNLTEATDE